MKSNHEDSLKVKLITETTSTHTYSNGVHSSKIYLSCLLCFYDLPIVWQVGKQIPSVVME